MKVYRKDSKLIVVLPREVSDSIRLRGRTIMGHRETIFQLSSSLGEETSRAMEMIRPHAPLERQLRIQWSTGDVTLDESDFDPSKGDEIVDAPVEQSVTPEDAGTKAEATIASLNRFLDDISDLASKGGDAAVAAAKSARRTIGAKLRELSEKLLSD